MRSSLWILILWLVVKALPYLIMGIIMGLVALNIFWDFISTLIELMLSDG